MDRRNLGIALAIAALALVAVFVLPMALQFIIGSDYERSPIDVTDGDLGAHVIVEPDDAFVVSLMGHPLDFDAAWTITEIDETIVEIRDVVHNPYDGGWEGGGPPPPDLLDELPDPIRELWSTVPERTDPPTYDEGDETIWYWPMSHVDLAGKAPGETTVALELRVDGELAHRFEFTVTVVDGDACEFFEGQESSTKVPHRCG